MKQLTLLLSLGIFVQFASANGNKTNVKIVGPDSAVCINETFQLYANGPSGYEYTWHPADAFSNHKLQNPTALINKTTVFRVVRVDPKTRSSDTAFLAVGVKEKKIEIKGANYVCYGDSTFIKIEAKYKSPIWSTGEKTHGISVTTPGVYSVSALSGCYRVKGDFFISSKTKPISRIMTSRNVDLCEGESITLSSFTNEDPEWSTDEETKEIVVKKAGRIILNNRNECGWSSDEISINMHEINAEFIPSHYEGVAPLQVHFFNQSTENMSYWWELNGNVFSTRENPDLNLTETGNYKITLKIKNEFGCRDSKVIENIKVVSKKEYYEDRELVIFPNAFSPNGDGINDAFKVESREITDFKLIVFDRWGKEIFIGDGIYTEWNGTNKNGELLPAGKYGIRYTYTTDFGDHVSKLSSIQLIR